MMSVVLLLATGPRWNQKLVQSVCVSCTGGVGVSVMLCVLVCIQDIEMDRPLIKVCKKMIKKHCEVSATYMYMCICVHLVV